MIIRYLSSAMSRVICEISEMLLAQGRYQTLQGYISLIPPAKRQARAWLLYWSGMSRLIFDPIAARKDLESAYHQFKFTQQDRAGLFLACGAIIESYWCGQDDMAPVYRSRFLGHGCCRIRPDLWVAALGDRRSWANCVRRVVGDRPSVVLIAC